MLPYNGFSNVVVRQVLALWQRAFRSHFKNDISKGDGFMSTNEKRKHHSRTYIVSDISAIFGIERTLANKLANAELLKTIRVGYIICIFGKFFAD